MDEKTRDILTTDIEEGLRDSIKRLKDIVRSDDSEEQHVISAARTLIQYSELSIKRKEAPKENEELKRVQMEHLQNALIGLAMIAGMHVEAGNPPPQVAAKIVKEIDQPSESDNSLPVISVEIPIKEPDLIEKKQKPLPEYAKHISVPTSIAHQRKANA